jgi:glyoxylase-like metal-dependent hydrolase (beta-lactamase superfamily II)
MKTLQSGPISIQRIVETERVLFEPGQLYPEADAELIQRNRNWLDERFIEATPDRLALTMQSFVIKTSRHNILVDPCNGNGKRRPNNAWQHNLNTPYLQTLAAAGFKPTDIDIVLCTHLHSDHVGWNTMLANGRWIPTFPRATYLFCAEDFDILNRKHQLDRSPGGGSGAFADSVLPIIDARQAQLIEMDHAVEQDGDDGVWLEPAPGHSPGHVVVHVKSGALHVVLAGDALHHPIQLTEPNLRVGFDEDPEEALATRHRLLQTYADTNTIILPAHFALPVAGRIVTWGDHQYRFRWLDR